MKKTRSLLAIVTVVLCITALFSFSTQAAAQMVTGASTIDGATKISVGTEYVTEAGVGELWYKFKTSSEDAYYYLISRNIDVPVGNAGELNAAICTKYKEVVMQSSTYGGTEEKFCDCKLEPNTEYYLRVKNLRQVGIGNFKFQIIKKSDPDKDDIEYSTNIELNKKYNRTVAGSEDTDCFTFETDNYTNYIFYGKNIDVVTHTSFNIILLNSYREEITNLPFYGDNQETSMAVELEPNTKYYIKTKLSSGDSSYDYYTRNNSYIFSIGKPEIKSENVAVADNGYVYNGKQRKPKVTVTYDNKTLTLNKDYTVTYSNNINAGKATVTVKGKGSYIGTVAKKFTIGKATQKIGVKATSYTKTMGNKSFSVKATGKGKITYITGNRKVVTVSNTGLVKIVGAGKTKITIKAAGNSNYKSATKTVYITVKPKVPAKVSTPKTARISNGKVKISWKKVSGATGYQISKSTGKSGTSIVATCNSKTVNKTVTAAKGKVYYYKVRAYTKINGVTSYGAWSTVKYCK